MTAELSSINPNTSLRGVVVSPTPTGREPELLQDCDRKLSRALANTPGARLHAREAAAAAAKPAKPRPDVEAMTLKYGQDKFNEGFQRAVDQRSRHPAYDSLGFDEPDFQPLRDELERLDVAAYSLGEILETTTGVLLVLSRLQNVIAAMGPEEARAVARFADAVKEAQS